MNKKSLLLFVITVCLCGNLFAWTWGSGFNEGDLEMQRNSIDGDEGGEGLNFDPDNDNVNEVVMLADGSLRLGDVNYTSVDGLPGQVLATDGSGSIYFVDNSGSGGDSQWQSDATTVSLSLTNSGKTVVMNGQATVAKDLTTSQTLYANNIQVGSLAKSVGVNSSTIGGSSLALGQDSVAIGYDSEARGDYSIAVGTSAVADSNASAVGYSSRATAMSSAAVGSICSATGLWSSAIGSGAKSKGNFSTAAGWGISTGDTSIAIGVESDSVGLSSVAIGSGNRPAASKSMAFGNDVCVDQSAEKTIIFGNGYDSSEDVTATGSNQVIFYSAESPIKVGINTLSASETLDVNGNIICNDLSADGDITTGGIYTGIFRAFGTTKAFVENSNIHVGNLEFFSNSTSCFPTVGYNDSLNVGMLMSLTGGGDIDYYDDAYNQADILLSHFFLSTNDRNYISTTDNAQSVTAGVYGGTSDGSDINATGKTLDSVNFGFFSECSFSGKEGNGIHNADNILICGRLDSLNADVTQGNVRNIMLYATDSIFNGDSSFSARPQDECYVILDETPYPWSKREDNAKITLGASDDSSLYYDGSNMIINPKEVGSGLVQVSGDLKANGSITTTEEFNIKGENYGNYSFRAYDVVGENACPLFLMNDKKGEENLLALQGNDPDTYNDVVGLALLGKGVERDFSNREMLLIGCFGGNGEYFIGTQKGGVNTVYQPISIAAGDGCSESLIPNGQMSFISGKPLTEDYTIYIGALDSYGSTGLAKSSGDQSFTQIASNITQSGNAGYAILNVGANEQSLGSGKHNLIEANLIDSNGNTIEQLMTLDNNGDLSVKNDITVTGGNVFLNNGVKIKSNSTNLILSGNNVGIGTTNPFAKLDVKAATSTASALNVYGYSTFSGNILSYQDIIADGDLSIEGDIKVGNNGSINTGSFAEMVYGNGNSNIDGDLRVDENTYLYGDTNIYDELTVSLPLSGINISEYTIDFSPFVPGLYLTCPLISGNTTSTYPEIIDSGKACIFTDGLLFIDDQGDGSIDLGFADKNFSTSFSLSVDLSNQFIEFMRDICPDIDEETRASLGMVGREWKDLFITGNANIGSDGSLEVQDKLLVNSDKTMVTTGNSNTITFDDFIVNPSFSSIPTLTATNSNTGILGKMIGLGDIVGVFDTDSSDSFGAQIVFTPDNFFDEYALNYSSIEQLSQTNTLVVHTDEFRVDSDMTVTGHIYGGDVASYNYITESTSPARETVSAQLSVQNTLWVDGSNLSARKVGIINPTPTYTLDVNGTISNGTIRLDGNQIKNNTTSTSYLQLDSTTYGLYTESVPMFTGGWNGTSPSGYYMTFGNYGSDVNYQINTVSQYGTFYVDGGTGNVGIGGFTKTALPSAKLEVSGDVILSGDTTVSNSLTVTGYTSSGGYEGTKQDIIRHVVTSGEKTAGSFTVSWSNATNAQICGLSAVAILTGSGNKVYNVDGYLLYDYGTITFSTSSVSSGDTVTIRIEYTN